MHEEEPEFKLEWKDPNLSLEEKVEHLSKMLIHQYRINWYQEKLIKLYEDLKTVQS